MIRAKKINLIITFGDKMCCSSVMQDIWMLTRQWNLLNEYIFFSKMQGISSTEKNNISTHEYIIFIFTVKIKISISSCLIATMFEILFGNIASNLEHYSQNFQQSS